jgi:hypothetical protein
MKRAKTIGTKAPMNSGNLAPNVSASYPTKRTPKVVPAVKQDR